MKAKNVVLGTLALTCAIGSAFATVESSMLVTTYVRVTSGSCILTNANCSNTGDENCKVRITLANGTQKDTNGTDAPPSCAFLKETTVEPIIATAVTPPANVPNYVPAE